MEGQPDIKVTVESLKQIITTLTQKQTEQNKSLKDVIQSIQANLPTSEMLTPLINARNKLPDIERQLENNNRHLTELQTSHATTQKEKESVTQRINALENDITEKTNEIAQLNTQLQTAQADNNKMKEQFTNIGVKNRDLVEKNIKLGKTNMELNTNNQDLQTKIKNTKNELDILKKQYEELNTKSQNCDNLTQTLNKQISDVNSEIGDLVTQVNTYIQHMNLNMFEEVINSVNTSINSLKDMITGTTQAPTPGTTGGGRRRRRYTKKFRGGYTYHKTGKRNSAVVRKSKKRTSTRGYSKFSV